jgi:hypothetical protein
VIYYRKTRYFLPVLLLLGASVSVCTGQSAFNINLDAVRQSVVFLHRVDRAGTLKEAGTSFLLMVPTKSDPSRGYVLLVTARHIVDPQWAGCPASPDALVAVFNKRVYDPEKDQTGTVEIPLGGSWAFTADDSVDIAFTVLNGQVFSTLDLENKGITIKEIATPEELKGVNSGAQIASAGLLLGASGSKRNYPIFKFGYVSSVPREKVAVACCPGCTNVLMSEWMIAASLVPGNSGSPIFFVPVGFPGISVGNQRAVLLGVQSTSFLGYDVAGMAPIAGLMDAIRKLNLPDADIPSYVSKDSMPAATPSSAKPDINVVPVPLPLPKHP